VFPARKGVATHSYLRRKATRPTGNRIAGAPATTEVETIDTGAQRKLRITANPTALAKLRSRFDRYWKVEEVVTGERYGTIELLEYDAAARRFVPVITLLDQAPPEVQAGLRPGVREVL
jgi:hypothetical protein